MRTFEELCAAQAKGAELLDSENPGWAKNMNVDMLLVEDAFRCVLGQIYGYYHDGLYALDMSMTEAADYGFNARFSSDYSVFSQELKTLNTLWREEIRARQNF